MSWEQEDGTPQPATSVAVGTGSTSVPAANNARRFLALCNDSAATIYGEGARVDARY